MVDIYGALHFFSTITKFVTITLIMFHGIWEGKPLASFVLALLGLILLIIAQIFDALPSLRNNIPPIVTVILIGVAELFTIPEIIMIGIEAFGSAKTGIVNPQNDNDKVLHAAFTYDLFCFFAIVALIVLLVFRPPPNVEEKD